MTRRTRERLAWLHPHHQRSPERLALGGRDTAADRLGALQPYPGHQPRPAWQRSQRQLHFTTSSTRRWLELAGHACLHRSRWPEPGKPGPHADRAGLRRPGQSPHLPNALAADPYLKQVVARTLELGVRGSSAAPRAGMRTSSAPPTRTTSCSSAPRPAPAISPTSARPAGKASSSAWAAAGHARVAHRLQLSASPPSSRRPACSPPTTARPAPAPTAVQTRSLSTGATACRACRATAPLGADWQASPALRLGADLVAYSTAACAATRTASTSPAATSAGSGWLGGYALLARRAVRAEPQTEPFSAASTTSSTSAMPRPVRSPKAPSTQAAAS